MLRFLFAIFSYAIIFRHMLIALMLSLLRYAMPYLIHDITLLRHAFHADTTLSMLLIAAFTPYAY